MRSPSSSGAIGEWNYYVLGSAIEVALLGSVAYYAWTWPGLAPSRTAKEHIVTPHAVGTSAA